MERGGNGTEVTRLSSDRRMYGTPAIFMRSFGLPFMLILVPLCGLIFYTGLLLSSLSSDGVIVRTRDSLSERSLFLAESIRSLKRSSLEIADHPAAVELITLSDSGKPDGAGTSIAYAQLSNHVGRLILQNASYESIAYLDASGHAVFPLDRRTPSGPSRAALTRSHEAAMRGDVSISAPYDPDSSGGYVILAGSPVYDADGKIAGSVGITVGVDAFAVSAAGTRAESRSRFGLLDGSHNVISRPGVPNLPADYFLSDGVPPGIVEAIDSRKPGSGYINILGVERFLVWRPVEIVPWTIYSVLPAGEIRDPALVASVVTALAMSLSVIAFTLVVVRTRQLDLKNRELELTITDLNQAQKRLLRTEKSAVLGSAIAGLSHELNTPIGIALTSATFMEDLARNGISDRSEDMRKAASLVAGSLKRASAIVESFRRVASSETDETPVLVELGSALEDAVRMLAKSLKDTSTHPVFTKTEDVYVNASIGALNRLVAAIIASIAAMPTADSPKLLNVSLIGYGDKAVIEFVLSLLPTSPDEMQRPGPRRSFQFHEIGVIKTLAEKDLDAEASMEQAPDGSLIIRVAFGKA